jgi:SpoVK/Ycf46/Vps4 family AAA+-type ATPase
VRQVAQLVATACLVGGVYLLYRRSGDLNRHNRILSAYPFLTRTDFTDEEEELLSAVVPPGSTKTTLKDIGGLEDVKQEIYATVILPFKRPELFQSTLLSPFSGVLLYGPPGTGKSMLAKALATECNASFINVDVSTLKCKWYGESEKKVVALFSLARKLDPAIIFVDEIDSLLGCRDRVFNAHETTENVKAGFLMAWQGLAECDSRVVVVGATNRPSAIDPAALRRLPRKFHVDMPDAVARENILRLHVKPADADAPVVDCELVASMTEGFSGSDLENLAKIAAQVTLREFIDAEAAAALRGTPAPTKVRAITTEDLIGAIPKITTQSQNGMLGRFLL